MSNRDTDSAKQPVRTSHTFEDCPDCDGNLVYPTKGELLCQDCEAIFIHEIRGSRHLLWRFTHDDGMKEVVDRAE